MRSRRKANCERRNSADESQQTKEKLRQTEEELRQLKGELLKAKDGLKQSGGNVLLLMLTEFYDSRVSLNEVLKHRCVKLNSFFVSANYLHQYCIQQLLLCTLLNV